MDSTRHARPLRPSSPSRLPAPLVGAPDDEPTISSTTTRGPGPSDDGRDDQPVDTPACHVTAVLVAFDAARWLPATLAALAALQPPARPADRHRQRQHRRHPRAAGARPSDQGILDAVYAGEAGRFRRGGQVGAAAGPGADRGRPTTGRRAATMRAATSRLALAAARRRAPRPPTRSTQLLEPRHRPTARSTSPAPSCCCRSGATAASRSARSGSASRAPAGASCCWTPARSTRASATSRGPGSGCRPAACWSGPRSGRTSTGSTRRCRCSATASSSAGGPTWTATAW